METPVQTTMSGTFVEMVEGFPDRRGTQPGAFGRDAIGDPGLEGRLRVGRLGDAPYARPGRGVHRGMVPRTRVGPPPSPSAASTGSIEARHHLARPNGRGSVPRPGGGFIRLPPDPRPRVSAPAAPCTPRASPASDERRRLRRSGAETPVQPSGGEAGPNRHGPSPVTRRPGPGQAGHASGPEGGPAHPLLTRKTHAFIVWALIGISSGNGT